MRFLKPVLMAWAVVLSLIPTLKAETTPPGATELLRRMDQVLRGDSHDMTVTLDVITARWERHYKIRVRMQGIDYAFARVLEPSKTEGQGFLRIKARLWQYLPTAERTILIPPSLMLDDFMGSDFSNDDFVKLSYLPRDYDAKIVAEDTISGFEVLGLELIPRPDAPVTYGKLEVWLRKTDAAPVRWLFYNEKMLLIRTLHYSEFKQFGTHDIPTVWRMENHLEAGHETTVTVLSAAFDTPIAQSQFTRENLEKYP
ncbi:MAG: outer membrane lipoprotein-sorting protein [Candidatus Omnitrophota bacterium]|nr:outer membrane lipoprotein-sorting protein [Candidatus Omnitrophota bacterium]